ncbi:MAG: tripartite tricarboxylate transporter TctB family protein [Armatimonadota bacterium]|nr:tripartite tricarboxylate transporter TctB family protein [Armatimonadota bacterium]MDR7401987.1 tripartite tricarboxylate transporter TctB family protein [Armatimonadota bacterium]MDR7403949.1 tripartite tricarboxylate transporter TctB family protein [Armatimonadota bacterium]MDR7438095.1 tripartite tricarboxylate transporter TctB family protein [Armatimonadota bacterium]MDR7471463.1 tripartite tricarboxylate transporter TctB family protein [Armatimonadota bacterium]
MRRAEVGMAVVLVVLGGVLIWQAVQLPIGWTAIGPGAGFFPFWLAVGVTVSAGGILLGRLRARPAAGDRDVFIPAHAWRPLLAVFLPMAAVVALMNVLGIYLGGALYLAGYMWLVGRHRPLSIALVSVLVPLALFFIFERWFLLPLPKGALLESILYGR